LGVNQENLGVNQENINKKLSKNKKLILNLIIEDKNITISTLSDRVGISTTAIENNIKSLKDNYLLRRIGSDKTGTWETINEG